MAAEPIDHDDTRVGMPTSCDEEDPSSSGQRISWEVENHTLRFKLAAMERELERWKSNASDTSTVPLWERLGMDGLRDMVSKPGKATLTSNNSFGGVSDTDEEALQFHNHAETGLHHRRNATATATGYFQKYSMSPFNFYNTGDVQLPGTLSSDKEGVSLVLKSHVSDCDDQSDHSSVGDLEPELTFFQSLVDRGSWLVGLLVLQSFSSFILKNNEDLLQQHAVIVRFLTMLVGAGGNAGNQASVRVIRGLATGTIRVGDNVKTYLKSEFKTGILLSIFLGVAGCLRAGTVILCNFVLTRLLLAHGSSTMFLESYLLYSLCGDHSDHNFPGPNCRHQHLFGRHTSASHEYGPH